MKNKSAQINYLCRFTKVKQFRYSNFITSRCLSEKTNWLFIRWLSFGEKINKETCEKQLAFHRASEEYLCIIGPSKGWAILRDSPSLAATKEKLSGRQSKFTPAAAASYIPFAIYHMLELKHINFCYGHCDIKT